MRSPASYPWCPWPVCAQFSAGFRVDPSLIPDGRGGLRSRRIACLFGKQRRSLYPVRKVSGIGHFSGTVCQTLKCHILAGSIITGGPDGYRECRGAVLVIKIKWPRTPLLYSTFFVHTSTLHDTGTKSLLPPGRLPITHAERGKCVLDHPAFRATTPCRPMTSCRTPTWRCKKAFPRSSRTGSRERKFVFNGLAPPSKYQAFAFVSGGRENMDMVGGGWLGAGYKQVIHIVPMAPLVFFFRISE